MRKRRRSLKCEKVGPVLEEQRHRISRKRVRKLNFHAGKSEKSTVVTRNISQIERTVDDYHRHFHFSSADTSSVWNPKKRFVQLSREERLTGRVTGVRPTHSASCAASFAGGGSVKIKSHSLKVKCTLRGSFSAVLTPILASKYSVE